MQFDKLLKLMVEKGSSDLFITAGKPPMLKVNGKLYSAGSTALSPEQAKELVYGVMNPEQQQAFDTEHECNFAINTRGLGRFRVSAFYQRNLVGMVLRRIEVNIPAVDDLGLRQVVEHAVGRDQHGVARGQLERAAHLDAHRLRADDVRHDVPLPMVERLLRVEHPRLDRVAARHDWPQHRSRTVQHSAILAAPSAAPIRPTPTCA